MPAGELRERLIFEAREPIDDGFGNKVSGEWLEKYRCAARVRPRLGGETVLAARLQGQKPVTITIRGCMDARAITTDWRARNARTGEIYNIRSIINPDEQTRFLEILAEGGVAT